MINESILGGLRIAVSHKSTLKEAMQSFYNAGYNKDEIEEAAKIVFQEQQKIGQTERQEAQNIQEVKKSSRKTWLIILLIVLLIIFVGGLISLFIFKDKIF